MERIPALETWHCFGCDPAHPKGLRLAFDVPGPGQLRTRTTISEDYVGLASVVHGGIIATVFDDLMMWCVIRHRRRFHVTVTMEQRLYRPTPTNTPLVAEASIDDTDDQGRVRLSAKLWPEEHPDTLLAAGSGVFVEMPQHIVDLLSPAERSEMEALFARFESE